MSMSYMFEVYYKPPHDPKREAVLTKQVSHLGGRLSFREEPEEQGIGAVCLTYEFDELDLAEEAADSLRRQGAHVEGPVDYGLEAGSV
jgi:hypothetical protein